MSEDISTVHPAAPRNAAEAAEDAANLDRLLEDPDVVAFIKEHDIAAYICSFAAYKGFSRKKAAVFLLNFAKNRQESLARDEITSRCAVCRKKFGRGCKCSPEVLAQVVRDREAAARAAEIASLPSDAEIEERRALRKVGA